MKTYDVVAISDGREEVLDSQATREDAEDRLAICQAQLDSGRLDADSVEIRERD